MKKEECARNGLNMKETIEERMKLYYIHSF